MGSWRTRWVRGLWLIGSWAHGHMCLWAHRLIGSHGFGYLKRGNPLIYRLQAWKYVDLDAPGVNVDSDGCGRFCDALATFVVACGRLRSLAVTCGHLRSLADTCGHLQGTAQNYRNPQKLRFRGGGGSD